MRENTRLLLFQLSLSISLALTFQPLSFRLTLTARKAELFAQKAIRATTHRITMDCILFGIFKSAGFLYQFLFFLHDMEALAAT